MSLFMLFFTGFRKFFHGNLRFHDVRSHTIPSQDPNAPLAVKAAVGKCFATGSIDPGVVCGMPCKTNVKPM